MNAIHWLKDGPAGRSVLGGKGESLAALMAAGFAVPDGFVLTAFATTGGSWSEDLGPALEELTANDDAVAVRSSATTEDASGASFAGQHETILDVRGVEAVRGAIATCIASLHSEAARAYRSGFAGDEAAAMAVVIQRYVPARAAGVAFSVDPVSGDADVVVVEAVAGAGEALVSGRAEAERIRLAREDLAILDRASPVAPVLSDQEARDIAELALDAERQFGEPQDIEYAIDDQGKLWILQSRPVTGTGTDRTEGWVSEFDSETGDQEVWTNANIQEVLPGLLSPFSMSVGMENSQAAFVEGYRTLRLIGNAESPPWLAFFYNRAYLNVSTTRLIAERAIAGSGDEVEAQYLGGAASVDIPRSPLRKRLPFMLRSLGPLLKITLTAGRRTERFERDVVAAERERRKIATTDLSDLALGQLLESGTTQNGDVLAHHLYVSGLAGAAYTNLSRLLKPVTGADTEQTIARLLSGLQNVESARISVDIWRLSRIAIVCGIGDRVKDDAFDPWAENLPDGWRAAFRSFMRLHGHRAMREMEASAKSWRADPAPVLSTARRFLDVDAAHSPLAILERQAVERLALTEEIRGRVGRLRRPLFGRFLTDAQVQVAHRERTKSIVVRAARMSDHIIEEFARRLVERGTIADADDVFFLTYREVLSSLANNDQSYKTAVVRRRREMERNRHVELPERFRGRPTPLPPVIPEETERLEGTGVSAGSVTGRARVIRDPAVDGSLEPGEILVAPVTDAGWTPLFGLAAGVVVDIGSALSHGSTVAREYGLPAVVNVKTGTRVIRTGDLINVDGAAGRVTILERANG